MDVMLLEKNSKKLSRVLFRKCFTGFVATVGLALPLLLKAIKKFQFAFLFSFHSDKQQTFSNGFSVNTVYKQQCLINKEVYTFFCWRCCLFSCFFGWLVG